jgi:hypothetical protein
MFLGIVVVCRARFGGESGGGGGDRVVSGGHSVHEMSLVFVPKLILVAVVVALFGHWQWGLLVQFTGRLLAGLPNLAR